MQVILTQCVISLTIDINGIACVPFLWRHVHRALQVDVAFVTCTIAAHLPR